MEDSKRYEAAAHAMQSGVAQKMVIDSHETDPKHLRTGVNSAMVSDKAIANLLINKGIITKAEYINELANCMEDEVKMYEKELSDHFGITITLG